MQMMASHERDHAQHEQAQETEQEDFSHSAQNSTSAYVLRQTGGTYFRSQFATDLKSSQLWHDNQTGFR